MQLQRYSVTRHLSPGALLLWLVCAVWSTLVMADDDRLSRLSPENQNLARRMDEFIQRMDDKYFGRAGKINGGVKLEDLRQETDTDDYAVRVIRGPIVEKMGRMIAVGKKISAGRVQKELAWGRFYSMDFYPRTPLVGMLHAVVVLQFYGDGSGFAGGWVGVMNGTRVEADMAKLRAITDDYFAKNGKDPTQFRKMLQSGSDDANGKWRRRPDDSGVSLYQASVYPDDVGKSWEFNSRLFDKFVDGYMDLIVKHQKDKGSPQDQQAQDEMRKRWLTDQLFWDPYSSKLVPWEVWSLANLAPVVKF